MSYPATRPRPLATNGFKVDLPETVEVIVREFPDPSEVKTERVRLDEYWFVHWIGGKLYHLRLKGGGPNVDGEPQTVRTGEHPWLLRSRLDDAIGAALPKYEPIRERPFTFLAQKTELIKKAATAANIVHALLDDFKVTPRFALNTKIYEPTDGASNVGLFVTLGMRHDIDASLVDLHGAGVDLTGMYVVRRNPDPDERRLAGRIRTIVGEQVHLLEATGAEALSTDEIKLEGSKENFSKCLNGLLGHRYKALMDALDDEEAVYRLGPDFDEIVTTMGDFLRKSPIPLAQDVQARADSGLVYS